MADIKFDIQADFGVISKSNKGWKKELNMKRWVKELLYQRKKQKYYTIY